MQHIHPYQYHQTDPKHHQISGNQTKIETFRAGKAAEHLPDDPEAPVQSAGVEKDPGKVHFQHRENMKQKFRDTDACPAPQIFSDLEDRMQQSPEEKVQRAAVPQTGDSEDDQNIDILPQQPSASPAQRDVNIIRQPGRQGNMPAPPKIFDP